MGERPRFDLDEPGRRLAGVCLHLSSLPGRWGIGDLGAAARTFIDWMQASGLGVWQFLPTGPTGFGNSPYQLLSTFAGNPLFIDLGDLVQIGLLADAEIDAYPRLSPDRVEYDRVITAHAALLEAAAGRFDRDTGLVHEFEAFIERHDRPWLDDYALYATLKRRHGGVAWADWEAGYRERDEATLTAWRRDEAAAIELVKRIQFLFFRQWQALRNYALARRVLLFGDLPIYLALDCADAWSRRELLSLDATGAPLEVAGVPPDYFSKDGQRWGNPLYRWEVHEAESYSWWIARLSHVLAMVDLVRLDHFRGFEAFWAIPASAATARDGSWHPGPGGALFEALARALGRVPIVAEDLGVITEAVTGLRRAFRIPGMQVLQFLVDQPGFSAAAIPEDCVCYTGTHDNDTTLGWFRNADGEAESAAREQWQRLVLQNLGCTEDEISIAMIHAALDSQARMAIVPMQDYLGLDGAARMNRPGVSGSQWRWRLARGALDDPMLAALPAMIAGAGRLCDHNA